MLRAVPNSTCRISRGKGPPAVAWCKIDCGTKRCKTSLSRNRQLDKRVERGGVGAVKGGVGAVKGVVAVKGGVG